MPRAERTRVVALPRDGGATTTHPKDTPELGGGVIAPGGERRWCVGRISVSGRRAGRQRKGPTPHLSSRRTVPFSGGRPGPVGPEARLSRHRRYPTYPAIGGTAPVLRSGEGCARSVALVRAAMRDRDRCWVTDEAAPHDDVGLLILDTLPCPQDTLAVETAALGDPLRALVVEMSDELNPDDSIVSKGPLSNEIEHLYRDTTASNPTIKPVERLGSTRGEVELNANLTSAFV